MISANIMPLIKNPELLFKYMFRERNISNFLDVDKAIIRKYLKETEPITKTIHQSTSNAELGTMITALRGPIVYACVRALKPDIMIETGVASGSSTTYILSAMESNGRGLLYSIDLPNSDPGALIPNGKKPGWLIPSKLRHRWELILGRTQDKLPSLLQELKGIDLFLHDSEHTYEAMMMEYENIWPYLKNGGMLLSDDIHWNKAFHDFLSSKNSQRWIIFDGLGAAIK